jgi:hypothetical protein
VIILPDVCHSVRIALAAKAIPFHLPQDRSLRLAVKLVVNLERPTIAERLEGLGPSC